MKFVSGINFPCFFSTTGGKKTEMKINERKNGTTTTGEFIKTIYEPVRHYFMPVSFVSYPVDAEDIDSIASNHSLPCIGLKSNQKCVLFDRIHIF